MKRTLAVFCAVALLSLTACGGVKKDATYDDAPALRSAVIKAGEKCPGETVVDNGDGGSIKCSSDLLLEIMNDDAMRKLSPTVFSLTNSSQSLLVGPNWIIQGDTGTLDSLKTSLGGELTVP